VKQVEVDAAVEFGTVRWLIRPRRGRTRI
jgi:hypothetical protein